MTVRELVDALSQLSQDATVSYLWDGAARTEAGCVYMSKSGECIISGLNDRCHCDSDRPFSAPLYDEDPYWETPAEVGLIC